LVRWHSLGKKELTSLNDKSGSTSASAVGAGAAATTTSSKKACVACVWFESHA